MSIEDVWFIKFGEYIGYWPGIAAIVLTYVLGVTMSVLHYKTWRERSLYIIALSVVMTILWNVLKVVVLY